MKAYAEWTQEIDRLHDAIAPELTHDPDGTQVLVNCIDFLSQKQVPPNAHLMAHMQLRELNEREFY